MGRSPMARSPINKRTMLGDSKHLSRTEKIYREIMGPDGKVRPQFHYLLVELEIDSDDLLDK